MDAGDSALCFGTPASYAENELWNYVEEFQILYYLVNLALCFGGVTVFYRYGALTSYVRFLA